MIDFEHFVKCLGPYAKHYTPSQLQQLHLDVQRFATILLKACHAKTPSPPPTRSPQQDLDHTSDDRTIESVLIERGDERPEADPP